MSQKFVIIVGSLLLSIAAAGCQPVETPTPAPTAAANAINAANIVTADGVVEPIQSAALNFTVGGTVAAINVTVGANVKKGDVLAKLDDTILQKQIAQAEAAVALAQAQLDQLQAGTTGADRAAAQAALDAAQKNYDKVSVGPTADDLAQLKAQLDNAKAMRDQAQAAFDRIGGASNPDIAMTPESAQLQQAINNYTVANAAFHDASTHPTAAELAAAHAQLEQAKAAVAHLDPALVVARAQLQSAQAGENVAKANDSVFTLVAPFDGIIGAKNIGVGDVVVPGSLTPAFTLGDVSKLRLETTNLAEVDAPKVKAGQGVDITLDAFPGSTFHGKVNQIAPSAIENRGDKVFTVWIDLDDGVASGLRWGMSATAKITAVQQ